MKSAGFWEAWLGGASCGQDERRTRAKRTIKAFAIVGEQGRLVVYTSPAVHPFLIFNSKDKAQGALWGPNEKVVPIQIIVGD